MERIHQPDIQAIVGGTNAQKYRLTASAIWDDYLAAFQGPLPAGEPMDIEARKGRATAIRRRLLMRREAETAADVEALWCVLVSASPRPIMF